MFRKVTVFAAILLAAVLGARAQSTDTLSVEILYSQLDTSRISTGILMDKVLPAGPHFYSSNGVNPEAPVLGCFAALDNLWLLRQGTVKDTLMPKTLTLVDSARSYIAREGNYPIILVDYNYNLIDSLALQDSLLTLQDSVLIDGPDFSISPYQTHRFIIANVLDSFFVNTASFVFEPEFYFSNTSVPQEVEIDFGDGQGFRVVTFGVPLTPSYDDFTPDYDGKTATMKVRIRKNGQWVSTSFKTQIIGCSASNVPTPSPAPWPNGNNFRNGNISAAPFDIAPVVEGNAYVYYRANPATGEQNLFKKPVIIIEGFETGNYDPNKAENFRMGDFGWCQLWGGPFGVLKESDLKESPQLFNQLHEDGYDIIMLDFKDSKRSLINNAALVRELIFRVNQYKTTDAEPNIIIGASAGGLISRYALAYMEQQGEDHCTNLWISLDAPHKGANISLGAQYMLDFMATNSVNQVAEAQVMRQALNSKAAKQLLLYNIFQSNKGYYPTSQNFYPALLVDAVSQNHLDFRGIIENMGYPQNLKKVAIASGSRTAQDQGFSGIAKLYSVSAVFSGWKFPAYVFGYLDLDYWDSGDFWAAGHIHYTAYFILYGIPIRSKTDYRSYRNIANLPSLDRVPGGKRQLAREIRETVANTSLDGFDITFQTNTFYQRDQCFVPSISALDLNTTDYFFDIEGGITNQNLPTPFDDVNIPVGNTMHVEITDGTVTTKGNNIDFTLAKVNLVAPVSNPVLTTIYNYGQENIVSHTQVLNNGQLHLYGNFSDSNTGQTPPVGNNHVYKLGSGCLNANLTVEQNGELILGDASVGNKTELIVLPGAGLTIGNDGKLKVQEGSKLIIEDGANFIFEDGAQIELLGPNSTLEIRGKLTIGNNADFTFTGNGHLIFDQDVKWGTNSFGHPYIKIDEYMAIGTNATFKVLGPNSQNMNHLLIEARKPVYLRMENGSSFKEVSIMHGRVALHQGALLFSYSPTIVQWTHFDAAVPGQLHEGFRLWHNSGPNYILHNRFSNGKRGALIHWIGGGSPILVANSDFDNNEIGLEVQGGNFNVNNCDFTTNIHGLKGLNLTGHSSLTNSNLIGNNTPLGYGTYLHAQNGASINIGNSEFSGHSAAGLWLGADMNARVTCSEFTFNSGYGILAGTSSALDIGEAAENQFAGNGIHDIYINGDEQKSAIYLDQGFNDFSARGQNGGMYLRCEFNNDMPVFLGGSPEIEADNNKMPTYTQNGVTFMPVSFRYRFGGVLPFYQVTLNIPNNLGSVARDCAGGPGVLDPGHQGVYRVLKSYPAGSGGLINSLEYPNSTLRLSAMDAIDRVSFGEALRADDSALVRLIGILDSPVSQPDIYTARIRTAVYQQMHQALNNSYQNGGLVNVQGDDSFGVNDTVAAAIAVIDQFILELDESDTASQNFNFRYHLDKVHAYRVSGHYSMALSELASSSSWSFNYEHYQRVSYWECVCNAEYAYFNNEVEEEGFGLLIESCEDQFAGYNFKTDDLFPQDVEAYRVESKTDLSGMFLYPQPVADAFTLEVAKAFDGVVEYSITDVTGKAVSGGSLSWKGKTHILNVSALSSGVYIIHLQRSDAPSKAIKFVKQ